MSFWVILIVSVIAIFPMFLLWAWIHEMSHILAAMRQVGVRRYSINLMPEMHLGTWQWASCRYVPDRPLRQGDQWRISLAPRIPDIIAAFLFPMCVWLPTPVNYIWFVVMGGGLIDLINGSVGRCPTSDLQRASDAIPMNPWVLRAFGFFIVFVSVGLALTLSL